MLIMLNMSFYVNIKVRQADWPHRALSRQARGQADQVTQLWHPDIDDILQGRHLLVQQHDGQQSPGSRERLSSGDAAVPS